MATIFSRIIAGEIPCHKVAEDAENFAFLDINPVRKGHVLVVPKMETDYIFDLPEERSVSLQKFSAKVAKALKSATGAARIGVAVLGMEVPHAHIHLIPLNSEKDMDLFGPKLSLPAEEMQDIAGKIAAEIK